MQKYTEGASVGAFWCAFQRYVGSYSHLISCSLAWQRDFLDFARHAHGSLNIVFQASPDSQLVVGIFLPFIVPFLEPLMGIPLVAFMLV